MRNDNQTIYSKERKTMKEAAKNLIESMDELMNRLMKETVNRDTLKICPQMIFLEYGNVLK